ncbi:hypothetical protein BX600DRAFT_524728 [Xylariales sp. PMI_506]|nr:hypothetical protein BX600DRAFT_524728 [Xylariales sp. PMI_506]
MVEYMGTPPAGEGRWDAPSRVGMLQAVGAVCCTIATIAFSLRAFTRIHITKMSMRADDYLTGISMLMVWAFYAITVCMAKYGGAAHHMWQTTLEEYTAMLQWTLGLATSYILSSEIAKISILVFYHKLSPDNAFRITIKVMIGVLICYSALYILLNIFGCTPVSDAWNITAQAAGTTNCIDKGSFYLAAVVINVCIDFIILFLPLRILINLEIPRRRKISLFLLFATGGFTIIAAIINSVLTVRLFKSDDYNWDITIEMCWMYGELTGCVVAASASSLKPFFSVFLPDLMGMSSKTKSNPQSNMYPHKSREVKRMRDRDYAIELESDDAASGKKNQDDDETQLWAVTPKYKVSSAKTPDSGEPTDYEWPMASPRSADGRINVVREVKITHMSS